MSKFWDKLGAFHEEQLKDGVGGFRNTVATRYFTDKRNDHEGYIKMMANMVNIDMSDSMFGNPVAVEMNGYRVTQDLCTSMLEVGSMAVDWSKIKHVVEIGAGYGRTAYVILKRYPHIKYTILDVEPAIRLSKQMLTEQFPNADLEFLPPLSPVKDVDLFIAISVLTELSKEEFKQYFKMFQEGKYLYFKDWKSHHNREDDWKMFEDRWPIPDSWVRKFWKNDPVTENFFEAMYEIR